MKRKTIIIFTVLFTLFSISNLVFAGTSSNLTDISNHWAKENIEILDKEEAINGYKDNTFKPDNTMTRAEFTKILVSLLHGEQDIAETGHWAGWYMEKAFEEGYAIRTEFGGYDVEITRGEIARMISRALKEDPTDIEKLKKQITDFSQIPFEYQEHVAKVYAAGIITGYPDGEFKPNNTATRAEATTMLLRFLDPSKRQVPIEKPIEVKPEQPKNYKEITDLSVSKPFKDLNLGGTTKTEGIPTEDGSTFEKAYYGTVKDFPIRVGNFVITAIETNKGADKLDPYGFSKLYLKGYALSDGTLAYLHSGYVDNQNQYRFRGMIRQSQASYDFLKKHYADIVGLTHLGVKDKVPFTTMFALESANDWEFDSNQYKFKLSQVDHIVFYDYLNTDKTFLLIENPFK